MYFINEWLFGLSPYFKILNNAAMNILACVFLVYLCTHFTLEFILRNGITGSNYSYCQIY